MKNPQASIILITVLTSPQVFSANCDKLLEMGYTNIEESVSTTDTLTSAFRNICETTYSSASESKKKEIDLGIDIVNKLSGNLGWTDSGSSTEERQTHICDWWSSQSAYHHYASDRSETIYDGALDAWTQCNTLDGQGIHTDISITSDSKAATVRIWNSVGNNTNFTGLLQPQAGKATCKLAKGDGSPTVKATEKTKFVLGPNTATFSCTRAKIVDPSTNRAYYPETRLTFSVASTNQINTR